MVSLPTIGSGVQGPSPTAILNLMRRLEQLRLAEQGAAEIAGGPVRQYAPTPTPTPVVPAPPPEDPGFLRSVLPQILDVAKMPVQPLLDAWKGYQKYTEELVQPTTAAVGGLLELGPKWSDRGVLPNIGALGGSPEQQERRQQAASALRGLFSGEVGLRETGTELGRIQREKPFVEQLLSEFVSPLGLLENIGTGFGIGKIAGLGAVGAAKAIPAAAAAKAAARPTIRLSEVEEIMPLLNSSEFAKDINIPGSRWVKSKIAWETEPDNVSGNINRVAAYFDDQAAEASRLELTQVMKMGDAKKLFNLGPDFMSKNATVGKSGQTMKGKSVNEIFQHPEKFAEVLTKEQIAWMDNVADRIKNLNKYLVEIGAQEELLLEVPGRYFPNVWKMFEKMELVRKNGSKMGTPFYMKSRVYEEASEAIKVGFRPGDPMEAMTLLFNAMYKRARDKRVVDMFKPHGYTEAERLAKFSPPITANATEMSARFAGVQQARKFITQFSNRAPGAAMPGTDSARRIAPELMDELDKAAKLTGEAREKAFETLRKKADDFQEIAKANKEAADQAVKDLPRLAGVQQGEFQFKVPGQTDRIFTSTEFVNAIMPEAALLDMRTLPKKQIENLRRLLEPETNKFLSFASNASSSLRSMQAGLDFGVMMIHGLPTLLTNPAKWADAMSLSFRSISDPTAMARFMDDHWDTVQKLYDRNLLQGAGSEYVEGLKRGGFINRFLKGVEHAAAKGDLDRVSAYPKFAGRKSARGAMKAFDMFETQFNTNILASKIHLWEALEPLALKSGKAGAMDELAKHVAKMTGTISMANMGLKPTTNQVLSSFFMFAPRYRMATLGLMADVFNGGVQGQLARQAFGKMMASGLLMYNAAARGMGQEPNLDPRSGKFLTLKVGNSNVGVGSAFTSTARFLANFLVTAIEEPSKLINVKELHDHPVVRYSRGLTSPLTRAGWDFFTERNYIGDRTRDSFPNFFKEVIADSVLPFWASGYLDNPRPGKFGLPAEFFGARSFPVSLYERGVDLADVHAQQEHEKNYKDLPQGTQEELRRKYPEVQRLFDEGNRIWAARARGLDGRVTEYRADVAIFKEKILQPHKDGYANAFQSMNPDYRITGRQYRQSLKTAGVMLRAEYARLDNKFPDVREAFDDRNVTQNPDAHIEDIAYDEYMKDVVLGDFESQPKEGGDFVYDYIGRREAEEAFKAKWGQPMVDKVMERGYAKLGTTVEAEWRRGMQQPKMRAYFDLGERIITRIGRDDIINEWRQYQKSDALEKREMKERLPILAQIASAQSKARILARERDQDLDSFIIRWGYAEIPRHDANLARNIDEIRLLPGVMGREPIERAL